MSVEVLFFASLRETTGCAGVSIEIDGDVVDLNTLIRHLESRLSPAALASLSAESIRVAHNQQLRNGPFQIRDGDEVAFLPPVTGG